MNQLWADVATAWLDTYTAGTRDAYSDVIGYPTTPNGGQRDIATHRGGLTWLGWCHTNNVDPLNATRGETLAWWTAVNEDPVLSRPTRLLLARVMSSYCSWACLRGYTEANPASFIDQRTVAD